MKRIIILLGILVAIVVLFIFIDELKHGLELEKGRERAESLKF